MNTSHFPRVLGAITVVFLLPMLLRADAPAASTEKLVYSKPAGVTEKTRIIAKEVHVRGGADPRIPDGLNLIILCPDHTGLTVQEHPSIFWYVNKPVKDVKFKVTVLADSEPEPLFEKTWDADKEVGIQRLDLKDLQKTLEPNTDYKVSVTILLNSSGKSGDVLTSGFIKRITASDKLVSKLLTRPTPAERAIVYARQGIWYDALAAISDQIAADPDNKQLHKTRAELLKQGDLPDAAAYDQGLVGN